MPRLSLVLGFGPMLLLLLIAVAAWGAPPRWQVAALTVGCVWATALLFFLAGVERGMSFRPDDSSVTRQVASALALFALAFAALLAPPAAAFVLLACGFGAVGIVDRAAARRGLAPPHFAVLRPAQAAVAVPALLALFLRAVALG